MLVLLYTQSSQGDRGYIRTTPSGAGQSMNSTKRDSLADYDGLLADVVQVIDEARRAAARAVNAAMTATYWLIGRRVVEEEQRGAARADYGEQLVKRLAQDLSSRFGRGFSKRNLWQMRAFYLAWPLEQPPVSAQKSASSPTRARTGRIVQTASAQMLGALAQECAARFPLPWSHYVRLLAVRSAYARVLRERSLARRLDDPSARSPNSVPVL